MTKKTFVPALDQIPSCVYAINQHLHGSGLEGQVLNYPGLEGQVLNYQLKIIRFITEREKRQVARWIAMRLCQTVGGMSLSQIADVFHISGISHQISQLRQLLQTAPETDDEFQLPIQYLTP